MEDVRKGWYARGYVADRDEGPLETGFRLVEESGECLGVTVVLVELHAVV